MIELTEAQLQAVRREPLPRFVDPETNETYVVVRADEYDRLRLAFQQDTIYTTAETLDEVMAEDDAADPYLAELQNRYGGKADDAAR